MSRLVDFYHYTTADSADGIKRSKQINETYAHHGLGVYGTKIPPEAGQDQIAINNWTVGWESRQRRGSVDFVFHLKIPRSRLEEHKLPPNRQLYVHRGPIRLDDYKWKCLEV